MGLGLLDFIAGMVDSKPDVPDAPQIHPGQDQAAAIDKNNAALPGAEKLAGNVNQFNYDQLNKFLSQAIPGFSDLQSKIGSQLSQQVSGQIPDDVLQAIQRGGAEKALAGGFGGSRAATNLTARDLGLKSLDIINNGISSAERWMSSSKALSVPNQFDLSSMFITPGQVMAADQFNQTAKFQRDFVSNQVDQQYSWQHQLSEGIRADSSNMAKIMQSVVGSALGGAI